MAETGQTTLAVVERGNPGQVLGRIALTDLLKGRVRALEEESRRDRVLRLDTALPLRRVQAPKQIVDAETV
jgi:hypothetical protein